MALYYTRVEFATVSEFSLGFPGAVTTRPSSSLTGQHQLLPGPGGVSPGQQQLQPGPAAASPGQQQLLLGQRGVSSRSGSLEMGLKKNPMDLKEEKSEDDLVSSVQVK